MHCIKEFILHRQGYEHRACSQLWKSGGRVVVLAQLGCVLLLRDLLSFCIALMRATDCAKKEKWKNKAMLSHLICLTLIASSYVHLENPSLPYSYNILSQTNPERVYSIGLPDNQTHTQHKPTAGLTCILIFFVSPPGWEINTSYQPSVGWPLVEEVHAARDFWSESNSRYTDVLKAFSCLTSFITITTVNVSLWFDSESCYHNPQWEEKSLLSNAN